MNFEDQLTVLIDAKKFLRMFKDSDKTDNCSENEVYQKCGTKCVLSCRFASSAFGIILSKEECNEESECVQGCFCEDGLVRHGEKCIRAAECSARKGRTKKMIESQHLREILSLYELTVFRQLGLFEKIINSVQVGKVEKL